MADGLYSYPNFVRSQAERVRWDLCLHIAETISSTFESDGVPDPIFVTYTSRGLYHSPVVTGQIEAMGPAPEAFHGELDRC